MFKNPFSAKIAAKSLAAFPSAAEVLKMQQRVDALASEMAPDKAVLWAGKSAEMVKEVTTPEDAEAAQAAQAFAKDPSADLQQKALEAAKAVIKPGPGAMAAQAAGLASGPDLSQEAGKTVNTDALTALSKKGKEGVAGLVAGAVKLAAALKSDPDKVAAATDSIPKVNLDEPEMPKIPEIDPQVVMPAEQALQQLNGEQLGKSADALKPFLDVGEKIKCGEQY